MLSVRLEQERRRGRGGGEKEEAKIRKVDTSIREDETVKKAPYSGDC